MKKSINYIGFFDFLQSNDQRYFVLSAIDKMQYICDKLIGMGYDVNIISASWSTSSTLRFYRGKVKTMGHITLKLFSTFGGKFKFIRKLNIILLQLNLFIYLCTRIKSRESIIVYHSLAYQNVILLAKKIKKLEIILEVEEIYQNASNYSQYICSMEYKLFNKADKYIFSTELLNVELNEQRKPYIILYGTYHVEKQIVNKFNDGKIHVVYAGTFDSYKGGAEFAIKMTKFLPSNYHVHILGFGTMKQVETILALIESIKVSSNAMITYDGLLEGISYIKFIQSCHIGLSTQNPILKFSNTSFPSKILSYMSNGITVVSVELSVLIASKIKSYIYYYTETSAIDLANAIMSVKEFNDYRYIINQLDIRFNNDFMHLINYNNE